MREINRDSIKLSQLRALVAVAEQGNFSEAALHLEVSQSAISHAIASLEEELGVVLLSRGRHGARLTPVGERVTAHAHQVLDLLEVISKEANLAKGLDGGQVRIASVRSVATHVLPAVIAQFRSCFPAIAIAITECQDFDGVERMLREGRVDIGFVCLPASSEFEVWELLRDEYVVLLPPDYPVPNPLLTWEQIAAYPMIMHPEKDSCGALVYNHCVKLSQALNATYEISEDSTIVSMVERGLGVAIMPRLAAEPLPTGVQVCNLPVPLERVIGAAILATALHPPSVFAFLDTLKETRGSAGQRTSILS